MNFNALSRPPAPPDSSGPLLSIVIPAMNEAETIDTLYERVAAVCQKHEFEFEVVLIDDGSSDETWQRMFALSVQHPNVVAIEFRRNFGKAAALSAGFAAATGSIVITMDADLQDDPKEIPRMVEAIRSGQDVVSGWKQVRHDPWHKTLPSKVFNALVSGATGVKLHDHNCGFKAYRSEVTHDVTLYGERHRFVPVLAAAAGYRIGEIAVEHHPRRHGKSKYGVSRLVKGFLDLMTVYLITGYGRRPLHLIGGIGLFGLAIGLFGLMVLSAMWVLTRVIDGVAPVHLHERAIFYYCILAVLFGAQCLLAGLLAELIVDRTSGPASENANRQYNIASISDSRVTRCESDGADQDSTRGTSNRAGGEGQNVVGFG